MNYLSHYVVPFSGLKEGKHLFDFSADRRFFAAFDQQEVEQGEVAVQVELEKRSTYLRLTFQLKGEVELICDRCLEPYNQPIAKSFPMLVKFSETEEDDGDEVIYLQPGDHQVEIASLIYEFIMLSIPIRHVHPEDRKGNSLCNPEMIERLERMRAAEEQPAEVDPRWSELKKMIDK